MQFSITQKDLKAVSLAMAKKDIRYYLMGVNLEHNGKQTRLVATDGHRLHAIVNDHEGATLCEPVQFTMPLDMVKKCLTAKAPLRSIDAVIEIDYSEGIISAKLPDGALITQGALDGRFPDYLRIIPRHESITEPEAAHFNPDYVADAIQGLKIRLGIEKGLSSLGLNPQGNRAGFLSHDGFTAIVMPMRGELSPKPDMRLYEPMQSPVKLQAVA